MNPASSQNEDVTVITPITPPSGWVPVDFKELKAYRDLFYFLVWRDVKVLYAQSILGFSWGIINPLAQIIIFSIIFGRVAKLDTDGIPYVLFSTVAIIPWTYMSDSMNTSSQSLVSGQNMLGKVYFPRIIFPMTAILAKLVDFSISLMLVVAVLFYYDVSLTWNIVYLSFLVLLMMSIPAGIGLWFSALAIRFRDVKFALCDTDADLFRTDFIYRISNSGAVQSSLFIESDSSCHRRISGLPVGLANAFGTYIPWCGDSGAFADFGDVLFQENGARVRRCHMMTADNAGRAS